jgi:hypothetical protein
MAVSTVVTLSNAGSEPTETTSLLGRRDSKSDSLSSITEDQTAVTTPGSVSHGSKSDRGSVEGNDVEASEGDEPVNPLFEGNPEMLAKMHLLFPAIALGVC